MLLAVFAVKYSWQYEREDVGCCECVVVEEKQNRTDQNSEVGRQ